MLQAAESAEKRTQLPLQAHIGEVDGGDSLVCAVDSRPVLFCGVKRLAWIHNVASALGFPPVGYVVGVCGDRFFDLE